ncbi:hypothetical protein [Hymenobacter terrenus]|uniref:hypothetical protein n=1 Tax=Hymenobacter terrenus TaxID=1629124 RepID=UPI000696D9E5|nr:hypothetical protein [Hymenobacter terrenus]
MKQLLLLLFSGLVLTYTPVLAQTTPSELGGPPVASPPTAPDTIPAPNDSYLLGRAYRIETVQGTTFDGTLVSLNLINLEFETKELGRVNLERSQVRRAVLAALTVAGAKPSYFDIGNGNRLFFAPTGRGLRKGENTLQLVSLYLVGGNFGITDNISLGGYISVFPGISLRSQLIVLTPKVSFPISDKLHVGAGALYLRIPTFNTLDRAYGAGILYGAATYGSADDNVTAGLGYGFFDGDIGSTPILQIGAQKRISRRFSLISENYIIANSRSGMGGLYGIKINWRRTSLGLGAAYVYAFGYTETHTYTAYNSNNMPYTATQTSHTAGRLYSTYVLPVYYDFTFRFGKRRK